MTTSVTKLYGIERVFGRALERLREGEDDVAHSILIGIDSNGRLSRILSDAYPASVTMELAGDIVDAINLIHQKRGLNS